MEAVLYNSMNGSKLSFDRQAITANNLANSNTPGFKGDLFQAQSMYMTGSTNTHSAMAVSGANGTDFSPGDLMTTGGDLDVAIQGEGWFAVQGSNGQEAYTRAGNFKLTEDGSLVTASGKPVLGDGGPISIPPAQHIEIGTDGTISIIPLGADSKSLAVLDRLKLVKIDNANLVKGADGLARLTQGGPAESDPSIRVVNGALEGSNVAPIEQMVNMIASGREFESHMKMMQSIDDNASKLAQLLHE